jgi:DMSO/TMAO reductase YedYZ molybdopterin-dependent catalytic subunit
MLIALLLALHVGAADLSIDDLKALGAETAEWTVHGQVHKVTGVPLDKVLTRAGFTPKGADDSPKEKNAGWKKVLLATAGDGYQAAYSCAEFFIGGSRALIVWEVDGKPLSEREAPLRMVVLTDKEPARSLFKLSSLEIIDLRKR